MNKAMLHYRYGLLKPLRAPGACEHNAAWLGQDTIGIEVTEPELAANCGLGNIDPQHLGGIFDISAIDAALTWPQPKIGAKLVTIRRDADAVGAMAVLTLRAGGVALSDHARGRIALISRSDRFVNGRWPGRRRLPASVDDIDEVGVGPQNLGAIIAGLSLPDTTIEEGIRRVMRWILTGVAPSAWVSRAAKAAETLFAALEKGTVIVKDAVPGCFALVDGFAPGALRVGYRLAPVVLAVSTLRNPSDGTSWRKMTISQYALGYIDLGEVARMLSATETGWGGSASIIGSPQGTDCMTSIEHCVHVLRNSSPCDLMPHNGGAHG